MVNIVLNTRGDRNWETVTGLLGYTWQLACSISMGLLTISPLLSVFFIGNSAFLNWYVLVSHKKNKTLNVTG